MCHAREVPVNQRHIDVSEDDLRVIAEHGSEGAASTCLRRKGSASSSPISSPLSSVRRARPRIKTSQQAGENAG